jgi:hypothetical protein
MWSQAEEEKQKKIHFDLIDTHMKIALIQPDYPEVWVNLSWNLGWNVSAQWNSPEMKYKWIRHAIGFLKVGIRKNPRSVAMLAQMGDIYHHKLGQAGESVYYREWVRRDEGRSTFQIAYEWYDRARKVSHRYDMPHPHFSAAVLNSLACHAVSSYARELTQQMYDAFADAARLNNEGEAEGAKLRFGDGRDFLAKAIDTWSWAEREWKSQVLEFPSPSLPHGKFVTEANQMHEQLSRLSEGVSLEQLPELLQEIERPTLR